MKISVIIPVYNVEDYVERCITSVCQQTYDELEIIIVDDGSTDGSLALCSKMAETDQRIRVFHKKNGGLSSARNYGLERATGDYICFVDSDDWISVDYCQELLNACMNKEAELAMCKFLKVSDTGQIAGSRGSDKTLWREEALRYLDNRVTDDYVTMVVAWNKLYHKKIFEKLRYPVGKIHEDEFVIADILLQVDKVAVVESPLYYYFQRENSIMGTENKKDKQHMDLLDAYQHRIEVLKGSGRDDLAVICWRNLMLTFIEWIYADITDECFVKTHPLYQVFCTKYQEDKKMLPIKYRVKYGLFCCMPKVYRRIFQVRSIDN